MPSHSLMFSSVHSSGREKQNPLFDVGGNDDDLEYSADFGPVDELDPAKKGARHYNLMRII